MITVGVDLATEPGRTAMATIRWDGGSARVTDVGLDVTDAQIIVAAGAADKVGVDCPLGWPDDFLAFVTAHHTGHAVTPEEVAGMDWRRRLAYRETDRVVTELTGLHPLSVATDRIGLTAMRAAHVMARLAAAGRPVDRTGEGVVVEVYPAAALKGWGLTHRRYKGRAGLTARRELLQSLLAAAPWLRLSTHADICARSDDAFDAVVAALIARAAALSLTVPPAAAQVDAARREGWIAVPRAPLAALV